MLLICCVMCFVCAFPDAHTPKEERHGSVSLPDTCLARIMTCLADSLEPGGLRGPSAVAKDLATAALVRKGGGSGRAWGDGRRGAEFCTLHQQYLPLPCLPAILLCRSVRTFATLPKWPLARPPQICTPVQPTLATSPAPIFCSVGAAGTSTMQQKWG